MFTPEEMFNNAANTRCWYLSSDDLLYNLKRAWVKLVDTSSACSRIGLGYCPTSVRVVMDAGSLSNTLTLLGHNSGTSSQLPSGGSSSMLQSTSVSKQIRALDKFIAGRIFLH